MKIPSYVIVVPVFVACSMLVCAETDTNSQDNISNAIEDTPTSAMVTALTGNWYELSQVDLSAVDAATAEMIIQRGVQPIRDANAAPRFVTSMFYLPEYDKLVDDYDTMPFTERITLESQELIKEGILTWQSSEQSFRSALTCSYCEWHRNSDAGYYEFLPELGKMRSAAKWQIRLAEFHIANNEPWEALRCYREVLALGREVGKGSYLIRTLVGIAIESLAYRRLNDAIPELIDQGIEPERLLSIISRRYRQFADPVAGFSGERIAFTTPSMGLKTLNYQNTDAFWVNAANIWSMFVNEGEYVEHTGPETKELAIKSGYVTAQQADDSQVLARLVLEEIEYYNSVLDRIVLAFGLSSSEWKNAVDKIENEFENQEPKRLSFYLMPSLTSAGEAMLRSQRFRRATNLQLLAITYRDKYGNWPESLEQLMDWKPEFGSSDPVTGTQLLMECKDKTITISWPEDKPHRQQFFSITLKK